ncbi:DUF4258 domain-containing protein [Paenibacillus farraposensis]|uniref:DUF4258 domain-containing protein n=1 Tax=Paenibacillus farraposensis TaxID=2807095 RepID=A0ABW4DHP9_9BACL|nr:DUF4258 domain-containing protein [Paenibacillus farraposensis]MCC3378392.1 DUF4258 domain-containing protein [Paenibacillus farraposensis]
MNHLKDMWEEEMVCIRKGIRQEDGYLTTISKHYLKDRLANPEYPDRVFNELDLFWAISNGFIVEGYDTGEHGNNSEPERIIIGPALSEDWCVVIVACKLDNHYVIKTVFPVDRKRYRKYLPTAERPHPE